MRTKKQLGLPCWAVVDGEGEVRVYHDTKAIAEEVARSVTQQGYNGKCYVQYDGDLPQPRDHGRISN